MSRSRQLVFIYGLYLLVACFDGIVITCTFLFYHSLVILWFYCCPASFPWHWMAYSVLMCCQEITHSLTDIIVRGMVEPTYFRNVIITARSELRKVLFFLVPSVCGFVICMKYLRNRWKWIFAKFTWKTSLVPHSDKVEGQGQRSTSPGTKNSIFWFFQRPACGLCLVRTSLASSLCLR